MAWTTPRTWVAGELVTASLFNAHIRDNELYLKDAPTFDGAVTITGALTQTGAATFSSTVAGAFVRGLCQGRLTLTSGVPVTKPDVTAAGTLYFAPYKGSLIGLFDGSATWTAISFTEISIAVPAVANQMYDVFVYNNGGTATLELTAWTDDTNRATALTTQNGVLVKSGATTRRYVGSVRTRSASQLNDTAAFRHVWNYYNQKPRALSKTDATASWTYTTATVRQANGAAANQVEVVVGVDEVPIHLLLKVNAVNDGGNSFAIGIGEDATTTFADGTWHRASQTATMVACVDTPPAVGRHVYSWNEWSEAAGTTTWYGTNTNGSTTTSGLRGWIMG